MIGRHGVAAGVRSQIGNHCFRATRIIAYHWTGGA
jgi:hypothetical protein